MAGYGGSMYSGFPRKCWREILTHYFDWRLQLRRVTSTQSFTLATLVPTLPTPSSAPAILPAAHSLPASGAAFLPRSQTSAAKFHNRRWRPPHEQFLLRFRGSGLPSVSA